MTGHAVSTSEPPYVPTGARGMLRASLRWVLRRLQSIDLFASAWDVFGPALKPWRHEIRLGEGSYFQGRPQIHRYPSPTEERITIGRYCAIAADVTFVLSGNHRADWVTTSPLPSVLGLEGYDDSEVITGRGGIEIGNDVWIGGGAMLLSGAKIGDGAVVGARAVVAGTVRPYAVVVGNPIREIRRRFSDDQVSRLQAVRWWDLPKDQIAPLVPLLCSPDVDRALDAVEKLGARRPGG